MSHLTDWLATLRPAELAEVLLARGDVLAAPAPRTVAELADRLGHPSSVAAAVFRLPLPAVQIAEAVQALGDGRPLRALASALGRGVGDEELLRTVRTLRRHALVWIEDATLRTAGLGHVWTHPIGLGRPVAELLAQRRIAELKQIAFNLGLEPAHHKQHLIDDIADWLADEDAVRQLIEDAPCQVRELLREAAWRGPVVESPERAALDPSEDPMRWATSRGLVAGGQWGPRQIPAEVALALRGPGYRFPFDPQPPAVSYAPTPGDAVEHESAAAAGTALSHVAGLLRHCARTPLTLLKSGGVGAREMSRLAAATGVPEQQIRFWLELCHAARLVAVTTLRQAADGHSPRHSAARGRTDAGSSGAPRHGSSGLAPTLAYDTWLASDPAERLAVLLDGWLRLPVASLHDSGADRAARAALLWPATGGLAPDLRRSLLLAAASLPEGSAADPRHVSELAAWRQPMLFHAMEEGPLLSLALWREAALLGVVGHDAVTELGRALLSGDAEQLKGVAHSLLPASETVARFQADLSAVVTGTPSVELADLLDGAADRESHDAAVTWRFSYQSVRRGYDAGATSDQLLAALRACAVDGTLPQPLEYLVRDVARRHGTIRVRELGCCLRVSDPAVLDEI
ncbi:MAG: helicase-associated domain-containing protein, partial [Micromonosporaceae bacterium]